MSELEKSSRREFLKTSAAVVGGTAAALSIAESAHAAGSDLLKVGLIGCGGRGTGAAAQAVMGDKNVKLTAMGDLFEDRLQQSLRTLRNDKDQELGDKIDVKPDHCFVGWDAYKQVIDSGVDVVLLCAPPHFRPLHLKAAIDAGKHVFAEKPVAVDAPGVRSVLATCEEAKKRNLSVVSGLCMRYSYGFQETIKRIHAVLGELRAVQANDFRGPIWVKPRQPDWTDMHWQMRNWYYFTWLSGDFNVEQHVHMLDACSWVMKDEYPAKAIGTGGRQVRTGPEYGNIYDHFSIIYEYANGAKLFATCRQMAGCAGDISAHVLGARGVAELNSRQRLSITTDKVWRYDGPKNNQFQTEHDELFASIRKGKPINNGDYMSKSTLLAIMGRMAAYTGEQITWEQAFSSKEDLTPARYEWGPIDTPAIAVPGKTRFV